jgi:hypothetical protein
MLSRYLMHSTADICLTRNPLFTNNICHHACYRNTISTKSERMYFAVTRFRA